MFSWGFVHFWHPWNSSTSYENRFTKPKDMLLCKSGKDGDNELSGVSKELMRLLSSLHSWSSSIPLRSLLISEPSGLSVRFAKRRSNRFLFFVSEYARPVFFHSPWRGIVEYISDLCVPESCYDFVKNIHLQPVKSSWVFLLKYLLLESVEHFNPWC